MEIIENVPNKISSATKVHPRRAAIALHFMYCCINMTYCYDYRCYCGMDYPVTALRDRCNCRKKCTGDKKKICGGGKYMSLYRTCETCSSSLDSSLLSSSSFKFYIVISGLVYHLSSSTDSVMFPTASKSVDNSTPRESCPFVHHVVAHYVYTRAKVSGFMNVSGFITFRVFRFARRLHYRGIRIRRYPDTMFTL